MIMGALTCGYLLALQIDFGHLKSACQKPRSGRERSRLQENLVGARQFAWRERPSAMLDTSNRKHFCIPELVIENKTDTALPLQL